MITGVSIENDPTYYNNVYIVVFKDRRAIHRLSGLTDSDLEEIKGTLKSALDRVKEFQEGNRQ